MDITAELVKSFEANADSMIIEVSEGRTDKEIFESWREVFMECGNEWVKAANMSRLSLEIMSRKYRGESKYGQDAIPTIIRFAVES